ncbi:MAG TPA: anaerobic ribonucleoside-triphosphate reductase activating protein [bacterium]|nr:anaerobic ribonucleoside-triphosphate reductase activating protein [bacterium]HPL56383.1 anaerobic ribonucleoside-triphosphate reductase activating protein [bacterium]
MIIAGLQKFSLIDYPDKICAIIFTRGCNFRCRYCHNPEICRNLKDQTNIPLKEIYHFLQRKKGKLDAVTITGGEPTIHPDLIRMIKRIKEMGFLLKLDTNGSNPDVLETIIQKKLVDYIAMDIKAPLEKYKEIMGWPISPEVLTRSINLIINSGIHHEFRTTIAKSLTTKEDLCKIAKTIKGAESYYLQRFVPSQKIYDKSLLPDTSYSSNELVLLAEKMLKFVEKCGVR